jgi:hypothetical protein
MKEREVTAQSSAGQTNHWCSAFARTRCVVLPAKQSMLSYLLDRYVVRSPVDPDGPA